MTTDTPTLPSHRGPRTAAPLRPAAAAAHLGVPYVSPRSSDRGSIAAGCCSTGCPAAASSHRGPRTAAPLRPARAGAPPTQVAGVTAVLGPRLHCGGQPFGHRCALASHRGPRTAAPLRPDEPCRQPQSPPRHRGPRTAAPLRRAPHARDRGVDPPVTAVLGPRLHCGVLHRDQPQVQVLSHRGPRTAAPLRLPRPAPLVDSGSVSPRSSDRGSIAARRWYPWSGACTGSPRSSDRGSIAATSCHLTGPPPPPVTAVLGPRLHCGDGHVGGLGPQRAGSPRSSDRGSIAAMAARLSTPKATGHRGPRTAAPLRQASLVEWSLRKGRVTAVLGPRLHCGKSSENTNASCIASSPRSSDRGSIAARRLVGRLGRPARVTAVLGPRLHCGPRKAARTEAGAGRSPRSSDRGSIAATVPAWPARTAAPSPRSSDRGSIAATGRTCGVGP